MEKIHPTQKWSGMTMTVAELIAELQAYEPALPVIATWEGVGAGFRPENFMIGFDEGRKYLSIDVDDHG